MRTGKITLPPTPVISAKLFALAGVLLLIATGCKNGAEPNPEPFDFGGGCKVEPIINNCENALDLGSVTSGNSVSSEIVGIKGAGAETWFKAYFYPEGPAEAEFRPGGGLPSIAFGFNGGGAVRFDLFRTCGGQHFDCPVPGDTASPWTPATDLMFWSFDDGPDTGAGDEGSPADVPWPESVLVRVHYPGGTDTDCQNYQLMVSR